MNEVQGPKPLPVIERFRALRVLGQGGMGIVYLAEDPQLDRPVALKLLTRRRGDRDARQRMRREAQALAKLSHPNVVQVYGGGMFEDRVYIAMELVEGADLRDWQRDAPRTLDELLDAYGQAGAGLAAAHAKGLVHRDFKPDNAVMGDDGRVRVLDFGLVRAGSTEAAEAPDERTAHDPHLAVDRLEAPLTATSVLMGTPAYMAPELHRNEPATTASDQFAFCVSLHEALYGIRPFAGRDLRLLVAHVLRGELQAEPADRRVPAWLRRIVLRGLSVDPADRWPSMEALLEALHRGAPARARVRWAAAAAGLAVVVSAVALSDIREPRCSSSADRLTGVWDEEHRASARARLVVGAWATRSWERLEATLDEYSARWVRIHRQACLADEGPDALDLRMACLDDRRRQLGTLTEVLADESDATLEVAQRAADALDTPSECMDLERLERTMPRPVGDAQAREVERIQERLAEVRAAQLLGHYARSEPIAVAALEDAEQLGYAPLVVRAAIAVGVARVYAGAIEESAAMLERAYLEAKTLGDRAMMGEAAGWLVDAYGTRLGDLRAARRWAEHAHAATEADDDPSDVRALTGLAKILWELGELEEAQPMLERALSIQRARLDPDDPRIARVLDLLGALLGDLDRFEEAFALHRRARVIYEGAYGRVHPSVAGSINYMGIAAVHSGDFERGLRCYNEALAIWEEALGPEDPGSAVFLANLGYLSRKQERYEEALDYDLRALELMEGQFGPVHLKVADLRGNISTVMASLGRYDEAVAYRSESIRIHEQLMGPHYPALPWDLEHLADVMKHAGDVRGAHEAINRSRVLLGVRPLPPLSDPHSQTGSSASNSSTSSK